MNLRSFGNGAAIYWTKVGSNVLSLDLMVRPAVIRYRTPLRQSSAGSWRITLIHTTIWAF